MENRGLRPNIAVMRQSFYDEGILDGQFARLEQLHRDNPNFIEEVVTVYFTDSNTLLATFEQEMNTVPIDFSKMDRILCRLKGNSASIGAKKVRNKINKTRKLLQEGNLEGAKVAFQDLRNEHYILRAKLEPYLQHLRRALPTQNSLPGEAIRPRLRSRY